MSAPDLDTIRSVVTADVASFGDLGLDVEHPVVAAFIAHAVAAVENRLAHVRERIHTAGLFAEAESIAPKEWDTQPTAVEEQAAPCVDCDGAGFVDGVVGTRTCGTCRGWG